MRAVNLMPRDERRAGLDTGRLPLVAAAGGVVVVTALAFFLASSASGTATDTKAELQAVETAIALVPEASGGGPSVGAFAQERSERVAALAAALGSRTAFDRVLRDVSLVLPGNVWLTKLEATAPAPGVELPGAVPTPQTGVPAGVTIEGATYTHDSVATVLARLTVVPSLTNVRLTSTALVEPQAGDETSSRTRGKSFVTFIVSASVRTEGVS